MVRQAPDHPRICNVWGSLVSVLAPMGMRAEAEQAIERQESILVGAKGADSMALIAIGHARTALLQNDSNHRAILDERKSIFARTEFATGPKSVESFYALREVAWAYALVDNWPEEQQVLATLLERTVAISGDSSLDHAHLLVHMANRASQNSRFEEALAWMDQAIEITRDLPDAGIQLPGMLENRTQIEQARDPKPAGPFYAPAGATANGLWFNADRSPSP